MKSSQTLVGAIALAFVSALSLRAEQVAVVMSKDHQVQQIVPQDNSVSEAELKGMVHQVGGQDPNFVPPAKPIAEPPAAAPPTPVDASPPSKAEPTSTAIQAAAAPAPVSLKVTEPRTADKKPIVAATQPVALSQPPLPVKVPIALENAAAAVPAAAFGERRAEGAVVAIDFSGPSAASLIDPSVDANDESLPKPLFRPDQKGLVVLPGQSRGNGDGTPNPFDIRLVAQRPVRDVKIRYGGVVLGQRPTALVNGRAYSSDDRFGSFNIVRVERRDLLIERDGVYVLVPRGNDITVRIPQ